MFVGMDVHRNRTQVCLLEDDGAEVYNRNVPNDQAGLVELFGKLEAGTPVVFEAAYGAAWVAELLEDLALEPHRPIPRAARPSPRPSSSTTSSTPGPSPTCSAPDTWPRPG